LSGLSPYAEIAARTNAGVGLGRTVRRTVKRTSSWVKVGSERKLATNIWNDGKWARLSAVLGVSAQINNLMG